MKEGYSVAVFVNDSAKEMSATARMDNNTHWKLMEDTEGARGFRMSVIARGLPRAEAQAMKITQMTAYKSLGFNIVPRPAVV